ncbi:hypothetical protein L7F22_013575 [Adiantum nelumboides]|nr:hypothetical protein [Adiantum nelumboides]
MGDHAEQQGMHFDPATMQMFQAFAVFMQQQHATERREISATKAIQAVVNKMDQFAGKDVTKYLRAYVKEMELHRVSEGSARLARATLGQGCYLRVEHLEFCKGELMSKALQD